MHCRKTIGTDILYTQRINLNDFAELLIFFYATTFISEFLNCPVKYYHPLDGLAQNTVQAFLVLIP